jgi:hypothetical protein
MIIIAAMRGVAAVAGALLVSSGAAARALDRPAGGGVTWVTVLDNETVRAVRARMPPGTSAIIDNITSPHLVVQVTPGDVEINQIGENTRGRRGAGAVSFVPGGGSHHARNIGATAFDLLAVVIKETRRPAPPLPPARRRPGSRATRSSTTTPSASCACALLRTRANRCTHTRTTS